MTRRSFLATAAVAAVAPAALPAVHAGPQQGSERIWHEYNKYHWCRHFPDDSRTLLYVIETFTLYGPGDLPTNAF